jgi:N-acetylglucosamine kinase-like BadF-type ATPase
MRYFLGADIGSTKTHALIADETGMVVGFGKGGPGNHEAVGYDGLAAALDSAVAQALAAAGLAKEQVAGAGFGVAGYDWPSEREPTLRAIGSLRLHAPVEAANDTILGLVAGAAEGWGVAVVSGTGCNCRGWDRSRQREGKVTGHGVWMGEAAGASELVSKTLQAIAQAWTRRGPSTQLTPAFLEHTRMQRPWCSRWPRQVIPSPWNSSAGPAASWENWPALSSASSNSRNSPLTWCWSVVCSIVA